MAFDELGSAGVITSIAFYNGGDEMTRNYDFYMKSTSKSVFSNNTDWELVSPADKVFSGNVTMTPDAWTVITLSNPFAYDGTSNVVLVADDNTNDATSLYDPHMLCRVFNAPNQALYVRNDNTNYDPGTPFSYDGTLSQVKNQIVFTKVSPSTEPVNITVSANPARAGVVSGGGTYVFGETCTVTVIPNAGYFFTGWTENGILVSSELSFSFMVASDRNLVANFFQAVEIGTSVTSSEFLPSFNYYKQGLSQQIYTAEEIGTAGIINSIAFYNEGAEKTRNYDLYLKATSMSSFSSTDWITVAISDKVFSGEVTMIAGGWTIINLSTPFEYDGTSNVVLVADDNTGDYSFDPHMVCSVFNTSVPQALYVCSDSEDYNPMSPPTSSSYNNEILSVKNHILLGMEGGEEEQTSNLTEGWNWWAPTVVTTLEALETALGDKLVQINSQDGTPTELVPGRMYKIKTNDACEFTLSGTSAANETIAFETGCNWFGCTGTESLSLDDLNISPGPVSGDKIISQDEGFATYENGTWTGTLTTLEPGHGYVYVSVSNGSKTYSIE